MNDDPEYDWIDKIRTPRASNEARQVLFLKLSSQVQRKMGLKASEMGANAVIGYRLCLDLEGDVGVAVRGIGTAVTLIKIPDNINVFSENALIEECVNCFFGQGSPVTDEFSFQERVQLLIHDNRRTRPPTGLEHVQQR